MKVVAVSDQYGAVRDDEGLHYDALQKQLWDTGSVKDTPAPSPWTRTSCSRWTWTSWSRPPCSPC